MPIFNVSYDDRYLGQYEGANAQEVIDDACRRCNMNTTRPKVIYNRDKFAAVEAEPKPTSNSELYRFAERCKREGCRVFVQKSAAPDDITYIKVWFGDDAANIQVAYFGGFDYGTCHKPCRECGTGFSYAQRQPALNMETARNCAACVAPSWATPSDRRAVRKWKNCDEWANSHHASVFVEL